MLAGALTVLLTISGCVVTPSAQRQAKTSSPAQKSAAQVPASGQGMLIRFYTQDLAWSDCGVDQCATLTVPIDYSHPDGDTVKLSVLKVAATSPDGRIGSLVVDPGGPGASGVDYARLADYIVTKSVRAAYG